MNNIYRRGLSGGFSFIKTSLVVILFAAAFLSFIVVESSAKPRVVPVNVVLDFSSGGSKSAMVSTDNLELIFECGGGGASISFIAFNGTAYANFSNTIITTPGAFGVKDTPNQVDITSVSLGASANTLETTVILESDHPGQGQLGTFGPGAMSHASGDAMILGEALVTYNLFGNNICSYTGNISIID